LQKIHTNTLLLKLAKSKQKDMNGTVRWTSGIFRPSKNSKSPKQLSNKDYVKLTKSPKSAKRYRVTFEDGKFVDFGADGYSNYTIHKTSERMRNYVRRHGGKIPSSTDNEDDPNKIHKKMMNVKTSNKENWSKKGSRTAGFWSRWLLWSEPSLKNAKKLITSKFNIYFK